MLPGFKVNRSHAITMCVDSAQGVWYLCGNDSIIAQEAVPPSHFPARLAFCGHSGSGFQIIPGCAVPPAVISESELATATGSSGIAMKQVTPSEFDSKSENSSAESPLHSVVPSLNDSKVTKDSRHEFKLKSGQDGGVSTLDISGRTLSESRFLQGSLRSSVTSHIAIPASTTAKRARKHCSE